MFSIRITDFKIYVGNFSLSLSLASGLLIIYYLTNSMCPTR
jgi:hypothetical protein